jgi:ElaB/YqjD/DUF883 family membrane-anchored ribosome-binding protein
VCNPDADERITMTSDTPDVSKAADTAADMASKASDATRGAAEEAIDSLSASLKSAREQAAGLVDKIRPQIDTMAGYAKDEPVKAVLIAAASGAALMAVATLCSRPSMRRRVREGAQSLRDAASESASGLTERASRAADRATQTARSTLESTRQAARSAFDGGSNGASNGASHGPFEHIADRVSEGAQALSEKAAPWVEQWRPQLDSVKDYAKEDPTKALLIAATTGAALVGLIMALGHSDD